MQTSKARAGSSEVPQRVSPPHKVSPRVVRKLKPTALETDSASTSSQARRTPSKVRSPKVNERRSPRSPLFEKKSPSRISELESQISQLQEDLKIAKNQLQTSESCKKQAQQDAEESKKQIQALSSKLEETQLLLPELSVSEEARVIKLHKISQERDQAWQSELEAVQKQHSADSAALAFADDEIQRLKVKLDTVAASEADQTKQAESANAELRSLKENLADTHSLVENMKNELKGSKESEAQAHALVSETLMQLESAREMVEAIRLDGMKSTDSCNSIASELDESKARVNVLEELLSKLKADMISASGNHSEDQAGDQTEALKSEVKRLTSSLEAAEAKYHEEQIQSTVQIRSAHELVEKIQSLSSQREGELVVEMKKTKAEIEELKAHLMDKETELQCISEENEGLSSKLEKSVSCQREYELEKELKELKGHVSDLKAHLMDKETELQSISADNEMLLSEINKNKSKVNDELVAEVEAARSAEREAMVKLGIVMEEADKSNKKLARVAEQLEAAQAANAEMEAELRRLKVQSDQWRKAAEAAASMLSAGNNGKLMERTGSLDSNYNHVTGKFGSPYSEDMDDDLLKKKNGNVLKKIGVFWKKPQK